MSINSRNICIVQYLRQSVSFVSITISRKIKEIIEKWKMEEKKIKIWVICNVNVEHYSRHGNLLLIMKKNNVREIKYLLHEKLWTNGFFSSPAAAPTSADVHVLSNCDWFP